MSISDWKIKMMSRPKMTFIVFNFTKVKREVLFYTRTYQALYQALSSLLGGSSKYMKSCNKNIKNYFERNERSDFNFFAQQGRKWSILFLIAMLSQKKETWGRFFGKSRRSERRVETQRLEFSMKLERMERTRKFFFGKSRRLECRVETVKIGNFL